MANLTRISKAGRDWTKAELDAYNITVVPEDATTFFGRSVLPEPNVDQELLDFEDAGDMSPSRWR